jgi:hypothetical protein
MANRRSEAARRAPSLPPCPGPRLGAFQDHDSPIEWLERLDGDRAGQSGAEGSVFKVKIKAQVYALKVVSDNHTKSNASLHSWTNFPLASSTSSMSLLLATTGVRCWKTHFRWRG